MTEQFVPQVEIAETDIPDENKQTIGRIGKFVAYTTALVSLVTVSVAIENREVIHALWNYHTYEDPDDDDIIPDKTGCELADQELVDAYLKDDSDINFSALKGVKSVGSSKPITIGEIKPKPKPKRFVGQEKLFGVSSKYFDTKSEVYTSPLLGITFENMHHEGGLEYDIDWSEAERFIGEVFDNKDKYEHPDVKKIVECFENRYSQGEIKSLPVELGVLVDDRLCLGLNSVVELSEGQSIRDCRSHGLGSPEVALSIFGAYKISNKRYMIIPGAVKDPDLLSYKLNKRFRHELIHIIFFDDLSNFAAEMDEQERFVQYIEDILLDMYKDNDTTPQIVNVR